MNNHHDIKLRGRELSGVDGDPNACVSEKLRHFYQSVQEEGIPDRFLTLLDRLAEVERQASSGTLVTGALHNGR